MIRKLRARFVCVNMIIVTAMLLVIFGLVVRFTQENLNRQSHQAMESLLSAEGLSLGRPWEGTREIQLPYFMVSISPVGDLLATTGGYFDLSDTQQVAQMILLAQSSGEDTGLLQDYNLRFQRQITPLGQTIVFLDISSQKATMTSLVKNCLFIGLLSLGAFFLVSLVLARWAIRPVEKAWTQQRQFVADASHELKTPLTVIMTNAELLQSPDYTQEERGRFTANILAMSHQMRGLVEGLLELARVDNGAVKTAFTTVNFTELICNALLPFEPVYFEKGLDLDSQVAPGLWVSGSQRHLSQVLDILLDNAAKYSTPGGHVFLAAGRQGSHILLSVASPGEAISREDLERIFQRFYRRDEARKLEHSYGLGLAIAKAIVNDHDGKIWAESRDGINTFFVQLPAREQKITLPGTEMQKK